MKLNKPHVAKMVRTSTSKAFFSRWIAIVVAVATLLPPLVHGQVCINENPNSKSNQLCMGRDYAYNNDGKTYSEHKSWAKSNYGGDLATFEHSTAFNWLRDYGVGLEGRYHYVGANGLGWNKVLLWGNNGRFTVYHINTWNGDIQTYHHILEDNYINYAKWWNGAPVTFNADQWYRDGACNLENFRYYLNIVKIYEPIRHWHPYFNNMWQSHLDVLRGKFRTCRFGCTVYDSTLKKFRSYADCNQKISGIYERSAGQQAVNSYIHGENGMTQGPALAPYITGNEGWGPSIGGGGFSRGNGGRHTRLIGKQTFQLDLTALDPYFPSEQGDVKVIVELSWTYAEGHSASEAKFCVADVCTIAKASGESQVHVEYIDSVRDNPIYQITGGPAAAGLDQEVQISGLHLHYSCPGNSHVYFLGHVAKCRCDTGYRTDVGGAETTWNIGPCVVAATMETKSGATWIEAKTSSEGDMSTVKKLRTLVQQATPEGNLIPVDRYHDKIIDYQSLVRFTSLLPGKRYHIELVALDDENKRISSELDQNRLRNTTVTHCACSDQAYETEEDTTGRPDQFSVSQDNGYIHFQFQAASRCEDGYAFTRHQGLPSSSNTKESFTPNYYFVPTQRCNAGSTLVKPGKQTADKLAESLLTVNHNYTYCVRAIGTRQYMEDPVSETSPARVSSFDSCVVHTVRFETSFAGKVSLEPKLGELPIAGVEIEWQLLGPTKEVVHASGTTVTGEDGAYRFAINKELDLENDVSYPVLVKFAKTTTSGNETVTHMFRCDNGATDCTTSGTFVYAKHLAFDVPIHTYDVTSAPITGVVVVGDTSTGDASDKGCPIWQAEVCLVDKLNPPAEGIEGKAEQIDLCVKTEPDGTYSLPALIGGKFTVEVKYYNHTFMPVDTEKIAMFKDGFLIEAGKRYFDSDFKDVTRAALVTQVVGGLCDKELGESTLEVRIDGCDWKMEVEQSGAVGSNALPAHQLAVQVVNVKDDSGTLNPIKEFFMETDQIQKIDLRELQDSRAESVNLTDTSGAPVKSRHKNTKKEDEILRKEEEKEDAEKHKIRTLRYQYDGTLTMGLNVLGGKDFAGSCAPDTWVTDKDLCDSLHVVKTAQMLDLSLALKYELKKGLYCDIVDEDLDVRVIGKIGILEEDKATWKEYPSLTKREKDILAACGEEAGGCELNIKHEIGADSKKSLARADVTLASGPPNVNGQFLKFVDYTVESQNYKACFIVEGDYSRGYKGSAALPTHKPLMVLRDPPGGLSYATYNNVRTSIALNTESDSHFVSFSAGLEAEIGVEVKTDTCAGGGLGAIVLVCLPQTKTDVKGKIGLAGSGNFLVSYYEKAWSGGIETTWSYQTSDDPSAAGSDSDTFVVPNLSVLYADVYTIEWNVDTCTATKTENVKFNLASKDNKPTLSFVTVKQVRERIIPKLTQMAGVKASEGSEGEAGLAKINLGLAGWQETLAEYTQVNKDAAEGRLKTGNEWPWEARKKTGSKDKDSGVPNLNNLDVWSGLVPFDLMEGAKALDPANQDNAKGELIKTNRFEFSGGGSLMEYGLTYSETFEHSFLVGPPIDNSDGSVGLTLNKGFEFAAFGAKVGLGVTLDAGYAREHSHTNTNSEESHTAISVVLGDEHDTDYFVIDVGIDPKYGTFVFNTVAGTSKCPHEPGTNYAAKPFIDLSQKPDGAVMPDQLMVFQLQLTNQGVADSDFEVYPVSESNKNQLGIYLNGGPLTEPQTYESIDAASTISTTLAVKRGPIGHKFPAIKVGLRAGAGCSASASESGTVADVYNYIDPDDNSKHILFAQPCPKAHLMGDLFFDQGFMINKQVSTENNGKLEVVVSNPAYLTDGNFSQMVASPSIRLLKVPLLYREVGDAEWKTAKELTDEGLQDIDFVAAKQDDYGYMTAKWEYHGSNLADGDYELKLETICTAIAGAPKEFNNYVDPLLGGMLDTTLPSLYGSPWPRNLAPLWPGEEVLFTFTEPVDCEIPHRFAIEVIIDGSKEDRIKVFCEDRKIGFTFDSLITADVMGKSFIVQLKGVKDLAGNTQDKNIVYHFEHANLNLNDASTSFEAKIDNECTSPETDEAKALAKTQVAQSIGLTDMSRLQIESATCDAGTTMTVNFTVLSTAGRRLRNNNNNSKGAAVDGMSSFHIAAHLATKLKISNIIVVPGAADAERKKTSDAKHKESVSFLDAGNRTDSNFTTGTEDVLRQLLDVQTKLNSQQQLTEAKLDARQNLMEDQQRVMRDTFEAKLDAQQKLLEKTLELLGESLKKTSQGY